MKRLRIGPAVTALIVYDFDGVMTDNTVTLREDGMESVVVNRSDGLAVKILKNMGIPQIIVTTEANRVVRTRAKKLGIPVIDGVENKEQALTSYCRRKNIPLADVVYIGNDINDREAMLRSGCRLCPSDAAGEIKAIAHLILKSPGGAGVVRELLQFFNTNTEQRRNNGRN